METRKLIKVRLLNDGGYGDMDNVIFPCEIQGYNFDGIDVTGIDVPAEELLRIGANEILDWPNELFWLEREIERIQ